MGNCCSPVVSKEVRDLDVNNDGKISKDEMMKFIERNAKLWAMLSVNCNIPEEKCRTIARDVAYQMAKNRNVSMRDMSANDKKREPTVAEFEHFVANIINQPKGQQEFFHRTVFAAFDANNNGYLETNEFDKFLDVFYEAGSIFAGDARLPDKATLKATAMKELDKNGDGKLEFSELRPLLAGDRSALIARS